MKVIFSGYKHNTDCLLMSKAGRKARHPSENQAGALSLHPAFLPLPLRCPQFLLSLLSLVGQEPEPQHFCPVLAPWLPPQVRPALSSARSFSEPAACRQHPGCRVWPLPAVTPPAPGLGWDTSRGMAGSSPRGHRDSWLPHRMAGLQVETASLGHAPHVQGNREPPSDGEV